MSASLEDQLFLRFCRTGDTAALAEVFDRTAPELLRVAAHVSGDPEVAEDLVQATFLAALESAREWDPSRRLVPWLVGILTHRAQTLRRQERRAPDPERVRREAVVDPVDEAQRAETWRELDRAIRELPEVYQTPLVLHLRHGLDAREIAEAMRRPGGTVRAQLSRGMELLRKALPVGIALSLAPVRGLAAARAVVLARAEAMAAGVGWGAASLVVGGVLLMKKALVAVVVGILALTAFLAWPRDPEPVGADADQASHGGSVAQATVATRATQPAAASRQVQRVPVEAPASPCLRVRARFADGSPALGVVVTVLPTNANTFDPRERAAAVVADGVALFASLAPGPWTVHGDRGGRAAVEVGALGETLCALEVPRGVAVRGHVRDEAGAAIAGARVLMSRSWFDVSTVAGTGPDGGFLLRDVTPEREVSASADGFAPSRCRVVLGSPGETLDVELVLARSDALLTGMVVDRLGQGIAGARVCVGDKVGALGAQKMVPDPSQARPLWSMPPILEARTDRTGAFRIAGPATTTATLAAVVAAEGFALWTGAWQSPKDGSPVAVTVTLLRGAALRGVARDAEGRPVPGASIQVSGDRSRSFQTTDTGDDGAFVFEHLPADELSVGARKRNVGRRRTTLTAHDEEELRWDPVLGGGPYLAGRVTDERGQPLTGWRVGAWAPPWKQPQALFDTDASGRFRIPECTEPRYTIAAYDPAAPVMPFQPVVSQADVQPDSAELLLVVEEGRRPTGCVTARVTGAEGEPIADATAMLKGADRGGVIHEKTDAQGQYRSYALTPGTFDLTIGAAGYAELERKGIVVAAHATVDLGTLQLAPAGSIVVTVRGADPAKDPFGLRLVTSAGMGRAFAQQDDGTWRSRTVPAGRYAVVLWPADAAVARVPVEVHRGGEVRVEVNVEPGIPCRFTFAGANDLEATWSIDWKTGAGGWIEQSVRRRFTGTLTRRFTPGTWSVEIRAEDGRTARKEFTVTATDREVDVQVPAPAR